MLPMQCLTILSYIVNLKFFLLKISFANLWYFGINSSADRKLFALKRRQHSDAIRSISNFKDYSKQYNMVQTMINKIFDVSLNS